MCRTNLIPFYLVLSAVNGIVPFIIALLLSVATSYALAIWGIATTATFVLICLVCLRTAWKNADAVQVDEPGAAELENAAAYR
jgi:hypothetical protein